MPYVPDVSGIINFEIFPQKKTQLVRYRKRAYQTVNHSVFDKFNEINEHVLWTRAQNFYTVLNREIKQTFCSSLPLQNGRIIQMKRPNEVN